MGTVVQLYIENRQALVGIFLFVKISIFSYLLFKLWDINYFTLRMVKFSINEDNTSTIPLFFTLLYKRFLGCFDNLAFSARLILFSFP
ncbi:MAG TPA: hypothetical protein DDY17_11370 [Syntrophaceae bacterium]|nr:hypothetical protein [Syntrophaceae bacterium]